MPRSRCIRSVWKQRCSHFPLYISRLRAYSMIKAFLSIWPMKIFLLFMPLVVANPVLLYIEPANWRSGVPLGEMARTAWIGCTKLRLTDNRIHFKKACAFIKSIHLTQSRKYFFLCRCGKLSERQNEFKFVFVLKKSVSFAALHTKGSSWSWVYPLLISSVTQFTLLKRYDLALIKLFLQLVTFYESRQFRLRFLFRWTKSK